MKSLLSGLDKDNLQIRWEANGRYGIHSSFYFRENLQRITMFHLFPLPSIESKKKKKKEGEKDLLNDENDEYNKLKLCRR